MTDSTDDKGVPAKALPTVFHHEGRRLFLIDGEPRVVDVDLAVDLGRDGVRFIRSLIKRHAVALEKKAKLLCFREKGELSYGSSIQGEMLPLLRREGLIAPTGVKPTIAFLNKRQARWIVAKSDTDAADDLLERLFDLYDAWEEGTLEPARPAVEPPSSGSARTGPVPAHIAPHRMTGHIEFCHFEGILFSFSERGSMHVWGGSVAEALGLDAAAFGAELAKWPQLPFLGEMPSLEGRPGLWLTRAHLSFLLSRPGLATDAAWRIAGVMTAQSDDRAWVSNGELYLHYPAAALGPPEARRHARAGAHVPWVTAPCNFLRDGRGLLRIRHDSLARLWNRDPVILADEILRRRDAIRDGVAKVMERHEVDAEGRSAAGLYLTLPHAARLARLLCLDEGVARDAFARWEEFDANLMEALAADQRAFAASLPSAAVASSLGALRQEVARIGEMIGGALSAPVSRDGALRRLVRQVWG
ncbi:MAG: hypothetical protein J0I42_09720 [Bosea sp.]|uniref:hypothetical protein n=1 Tax=Bosea sp. (in: a-proteobacteria) TaxID=1871050 RepID=UPI001AD1B6B5|nr:hypothetical protein [Bosea sp. (in: a-proteobacteria)]MBN9452216.1 hypothetical protein [Bosea sp. (in: a-proteobacteria)]